MPRAADPSAPVVDAPTQNLVLVDSLMPAPFCGRAAIHLAHARRRTRYRAEQLPLRRRASEVIGTVQMWNGSS